LPIPETNGNDVWSAVCNIGATTRPAFSIIHSISKPSWRMRWS
jgi:hypothetical protein